MKQEKLLKKIFWGAFGAIFSAGAVHTAFAFFQMQRSMTSAPNYVALFVFLPYALALFLMLAVRGIVKLAKKKKHK